MNDEPVIRVTGLRKAYGAHHAVDGLNLHVNRGEILAILGPNGAGKTTTVEILEGFRHRDSGEVSVLGEDPHQAGRSWREKVGVVLQDSRDLEELTVAEQVNHFAQFYPDPRDPTLLIEAVGLTQKATTRTRRLSGGQRRRLDVALGLIGRPELLFLDEPTTGFDPQARHDFWSLIHQVRDEGTTIVVTTHYLDEAAHLADRVIVVCRGKVVAEGPPHLLGDAASRQPLVRWTDRSGVEQSTRTEHPTATVMELAAQFNGDIPNLRVEIPTLEDIYLGLIRDHDTTMAPPTTSASQEISA